MSIYDNIKKISKKRGFTLQQVAQKAGLSKNMLYQYRPGYGKSRGRQKDIIPSYETIEKVARALNVPKEVLTNDKLTDHFLINGKTKFEEDSVENVDRFRRADLTSPILALDGKEIVGDQAEQIREYAKFLILQEEKKKHNKEN